MRILEFTNSALDIAKRIPDAGEIVAFRNLLIHGYAAIDHRTVWRTVQEDVASLHTRLGELLSELGEAP